MEGEEKELESWWDKKRVGGLESWWGKTIPANAVIQTRFTLSILILFINSLLLLPFARVFRLMPQTLQPSNSQTLQPI
jgi:hypothetical protein